jgi:hypothetical protein
MDHDGFPWRLLGTLLVDRELLTEAQLELSLAEQRHSGRLLGQILVTRGYVGALALARVLAEQHGVELKDVAETPAATSSRTAATTGEGEQAWRPLGRVLVSRGMLTQAALEHTLAEQARNPERRLGEILVAGGKLSGDELASALAEQHGVALPAKKLEAVIAPAVPGQPRYRVHAAAFDPIYQLGSPLYESANFLEAVDFAFEHIESERPVALEIRKAAESSIETVWTYSEPRAAAKAASQKSLVATFGFDPTKWGARP